MITLRIMTIFTRAQVQLQRTGQCSAISGKIAAPNFLCQQSLGALTTMRQFSSTPEGQGAVTAGGEKGETRITTILKSAFPSAGKIAVQDISGGCGSMYQVVVEEATEFEGLSIVKQHQLVNKALKEEIKDMHGIRIQTKAKS